MSGLTVLLRASPDAARSLRRAWSPQSGNGKLRGPWSDSYPPATHPVMKNERSRIRVYIATSLDGFIAGEDDDLSWLPDAGHEGPGPGAMTYEAFMADVGAMLMGRRTYDVVLGFDVDWPYQIPVLVASHRALDDDPPLGVRRVQGSITELVAAAMEVANGRDVYIGGGGIIRQALEAGLVDELVITVAPVALGSGYSLFAGMETRVEMDVVNVARFSGGMVQLTLVPKT